MLDIIKNIYVHLPKENLRFLKHIPDKLLFGKTYSKYKNKVSFDSRIVSQNLFDILDYSSKHTSFGRDNIPKKFMVDEVFDVLKEIPIITSKQLSENLDYYTSDEYNKYNSYLTTTGGTGRNPTSILLSNDCYGIEWSHMHKIWEVSDYDRRLNVKLTLRGNVLRNNNLTEYNPIYNEYVVNSYSLNKSNFQEVLQLIKSKNIEYVHGYPSLLREFYNYAVQRGDKIELSSIFLGSEGATISEKKDLGDFFRAKIVSWYGQTEKVILAQDLEANNLFKVFTSYGYPTISNPDENNFGELLGTTFINRALPLINYATGDFAKILTKNASIYLTDLHGRWGKDFIFLSPEKKIPITSLNLHSVNQKEILFYQLYQNDYGELMIKILPKENTLLSKYQIIELFKNDFRGKLDAFKVEYKVIESANEIKRSSRGKMMMLVQELKGDTSI